MLRDASLRCYVTHSPHVLLLDENLCLLNFCCLVFSGLAAKHIDAQTILSYKRQTHIHIIFYLRNKEA